MRERAAVEKKALLTNLKHFVEKALLDSVFIYSLCHGLSQRSQLAAMLLQGSDIYKLIQIQGKIT